MLTTRTVALLGDLLISLAVIAGCGSAPGTPSASPPPSIAPTVGPASPSPSPSPSPAAAGPLVTVVTQGGECMQGACGGTIAIEADGRVHAIGATPAEIGTLSDVLRDALATEIANADFDAIRSRPFTDTCPIAYDGQQVTYTFASGSGPVRIDSCEVVVDPANPLFVAVTAALAGVAAP
jgi:hypothetical protein